MSDGPTTDFRVFWEGNEHGERRNLVIQVGGAVLTALSRGEGVSRTILVDVAQLRSWWTTWEQARFNETEFPYQPPALRALFNDQQFDLSTMPLQPMARIIDHYLDSQADQDQTTFERAYHKWLSHRSLRFADLGMLLPSVIFYATPSAFYVEFLRYSGAEPWKAAPGRWRVAPNEVKREFQELLELGEQPAEGATVPDWLSVGMVNEVEELVGATGAQTFLRQTVSYVNPADLVLLVKSSEQVKVQDPTQKLSAFWVEIRKSTPESARPWEYGRQIARSFLRHFGLTRLASPEEEVQRLGIAVIAVKLPTHEIKGWCYRKGSFAPSIFFNSAHPDHRNTPNRAFTIAHELYHAVVDCARKPEVLDVVVSRQNDATFKEKAANAFAADAILPKSVFNAALKKIAKIAKKESLATHLKWAANDLGVGLTLMVLNAGHYSYASNDELFEAAKELLVADLVHALHPE